MTHFKPGEMEIGPAIALNEKQTDREEMYDEPMQEPKKEGDLAIDLYDIRNPVRPSFE